MKEYIIYLGTVFLPDKNAAAQRAMMICKSYKDGGKRPIIIGVSSDLDKNTDILSTYSKYNGFDTYSMYYPQSSIEWIERLYSIRSILDVVNKYGAENIHSIVVMDYMSIALWRIMCYCSKKDIRLVIDTVDWFNKSEYKFPKNIIKDLDTLVRMKYIHKKAEYMIAISKYLNEYYKNQVKNIVMIPGTVDMNDKKWLTVKRYRGNEVLTFGYAGDPGKNFERERLDWLIRIITELNLKDKKCKLIIAGVDKDIIMKNKPGLFELNGLEDSVIFLGKIPHRECLDIISCCDFSVIIREDLLVNRAGFPTKLSESFACGTPVISTPSGNISDYIVNYVNGFLTEDFSFASFKKLIEKVVDIDKEKVLNMHYTTKRENKLRYEYYNEIIKKVIDSEKILSD